MFTKNNINSSEFTHGGARPGAGRPKLEDPRKAHSFSCTAAEAEIIKKVLAFLRAYPELMAAQTDKALNAMHTNNSVVKKTSVQELQWLESEEESALNAVIKAKSSTPSSANFQWLESEAEQENAIVSPVPKVKRTVFEAAQGLVNIIIDKI